VPKRALVVSCIYQPVDKIVAARFNQLMKVLTFEIANADERPAWHRDSFFRRYISN
jgi:hypothetical protein